MIKTNVINGIIGTNILVFAGWNYSFMRANGPDRDYRLLAWCQKNLTCSPYNLTDRPWTLLTSAFSHNNFLHLGINCYVLYQFAPFLLSVIGTKRFMGFYCGSAVASSVASILYKSGNESKRRQGSLGASGSVYSMMAVTTLLQPGMSVALFGIVPLPISLAFAGMVGWDVYSLMRASGNSYTDSAGHLGGALGGYLYYMWRFQKRFRR
jgi:membrane associated rhomboid family serine protease